MRAPKRRFNLGNLLWLASPWDYKKNVIIVVQDSRLLFVFMIIILNSFILIWNELLFRHIFETQIDIQTQIRKNFILSLATNNFL